MTAPSAANQGTLTPESLAAPVPVSGGETPPAPAPPLGVDVAAAGVLVGSSSSGSSVGVEVSVDVGVSVGSARGGCVGTHVAGNGGLNVSQGSMVGSGVDVGPLPAWACGTAPASASNPEMMNLGI
jgi:hypothetical protein